MMRCFGIVLLVGLFLPVSQAQAVEYRLQVVNMWDSGFNAFVKPGELGDGASGPGLEDLVASLDRGGVSRGPLLSDRTFRWASETVARAYGAVHVLAEIKPGGEGKARWDEVRWGLGRGAEWPRATAATLPRRAESDGPGPPLHPVCANEWAAARDGALRARVPVVPRGAGGTSGRNTYRAVWI